MSLTTSAICRLANIKPETLRTWERRYQALAPARDENGRRVYAPGDLLRLKLLVKLVHGGHTISRLAALPTPQLQNLVPNDNLPQDSTPAYEQVLSATLEYDLMEVRRQIALALSGLGPLEACERVIAPLMREIGERWEDGLLTVAHEHAVSSVVKQLLFTMIPASAPRSDDRPVICCTLEGEIHEIGNLMAAYLISSAGLPVLNLGANLPVGNLLEVAEKTNARAVSISLVHPNQDTDVEAQLNQLIADCPRHREIWLGGPKARTSSRAPNVRIFGNLAIFDSYVASYRNRGAGRT